MDRSITEKRIKDLEEKIKQLQTRRDAERARLRQQERKEDTRRKILTGIYYLERMQQDKTMEKLVRDMNDGWLVREKDRELVAAAALPLINLKEKDRNRQRILIGAFILEKWEMQKIQADMDAWLVQSRDRRLFDLAPLSEPADLPV